MKTKRVLYDSAHLALFITLAALLVQVLGFALWCTVAVVAMYLRCVDAEVGEVINNKKLQIIGREWGGRLLALNYHSLTPRIRD